MAMMRGSSSSQQADRAAPTCPPLISHVQEQLGLMREPSLVDQTLSTSLVASGYFPLGYVKALS